MVDQHPHRGQQPPARRKHGMDDFLARPPRRQQGHQCSGRQLVPHYHQREPAYAYAYADDRGAAHGDHVAGDVARAMVDLGLRAIRTEQFPDVVVLWRAKAEAGPVGQPGRRCWRPQPREQRRARYEALATRGQHAHHLVGVLQRRGRTRMATSMASPTGSTRRLVAARCSVTWACMAMNPASMAPTCACSSATGQAMRTVPRGPARVSSIASYAASASTSMALQCS
jgi:hypothetical protein